MDPFTAALVLASAALHPLWYALVKRDPDPDAAFIGLNAGLALIAFVHALLRGVPLGSALGAWPLLLVSVCGQIAYGLAIVLVLKRGDLSAYYPIIRASPLAIVALSFLVLGERYRPVLLAGIALVLAGTFALQYRRGARLLAEPLNVGLAVLALLASAVYALADARLVRRIDPTAVLFWVQTITVPVFAAVYRRGRPSLLVAAFVPFSRARSCCTYASASRKSACASKRMPALIVHATPPCFHCSPPGTSP